MQYIYIAGLNRIELLGAFSLSLLLQGKVGADRTTLRVDEREAAEISNEGASTSEKEKEEIEY